MSEPERITKEVKAAMDVVTAEQWQRLRAPFERTERLTKTWFDEKTQQEKSYTVDYIGHAVVTDRLLQVDPTYTFEPLFTADGKPMITLDQSCLQKGDNVGIWGRLTILGVESIEFCGGKDLLDAYGRCLCRAAMRRGVALDLWIKTDEFKMTHEMSGDGKQPERRQEGPTPDPPPRSWEGKNGIRERLEKGSDTPDVWGLFSAFVRSAAIHLWGPNIEDGGMDTKKLTPEQKAVLFQKAAHVCVWLMEEVEPVGPGLYVFDEDTMRRGWARVVDGHALEIPDYTAPEKAASDSDDPDLEAQREAEAATTS